MKSNLKLAVITPVFNEELVIEYFYSRTRKILDTLSNIDSTILFVLDKSNDNTCSILREIVRNDPSAKVILLSSRFGHQMSLIAGIEQSLEADAIIMMDCDLQHPPELIPVFVEKFQQGYDIVYSVRKDTEKISFLRKFVGNLFYKLIAQLAQISISSNASDFRLISRRVGLILTSEFREKNVFLRGLFAWIGFSQINIEYVAEKRFAGNSKYSFSKLIELAMNGILSFSTRPLEIGIFVGVSFSIIACTLIVNALFQYFLGQEVPKGWTSLVVLMLLFGGIQLVVLGIIGIYIGRIYDEVKRRPRYIIEEIISSKD